MVDASIAPFGENEFGVPAEDLAAATFQSLNGSVYIIST